MTGRRLYELLTDEWEARGKWGREKAQVLDPQEPPVVWAFLSPAEKTTFNAVARRLKGVKR